MKPGENIEKRIKNFDIDTDARIDEVVLGELLHAQKMSKEPTLSSSQPNIWRIIMKNKKIQLTTVVTVILMISLFLHFSDTSIVAKAYAMSDMPDLLYSAQNLHMKKISRLSFNYSSGSGRRGTTMQGGINAGASGANNESSVVEVDTEYWIDFANGRWKTPFIGYGMGSGIRPGGRETSGPEVNVSEKICAGGDFEMLVDHDRKTVFYTRVNEFQKKLRCYQHAKIFVNEALGEPDFYDSYQIIGQEEIDGEIYDIWEAVMEKRLRHAYKDNNWLPPEAAEFAYEPARKIQAWLSPQTGDLAKTIRWTQRNGQWQKGNETTLVEYNIDMPDEIFALEPPPGYRCLNSKRSAKAPELIRGRGSILSVQLSTHIGFALPNGSIIACWGSYDKESRRPQNMLFKDLQMGGPLPKLPFEVYALEATLRGEEFTFEGYHLAYTKKNGEFYEWAIYIPTKYIDSKYSDMLNYDFIFRNNTTRELDVNSLGSSVRPELTIKNQQDFETYLLGAMAEMSNDGNIPEQITYEKVLKLSGQLYDSLH
jgi:hypothetical protein